MARRERSILRDIESLRRALAWSFSHLGGLSLEQSEVWDKHRVLSGILPVAEACCCPARAEG